MPTFKRALAPAECFFACASLLLEGSGRAAVVVSAAAGGAAGRAAPTCEGGGVSAGISAPPRSAEGRRRGTSGCGRRHGIGGFRRGCRLSGLPGTEAPAQLLGPLPHGCGLAALWLDALRHRRVSRSRVEALQRRNHRRTVLRAPCLLQCRQPRAVEKGRQRECRRRCRRQNRLIRLECSGSRDQSSTSRASSRRRSRFHGHPSRSRTPKLSRSYANLCTQRRARMISGRLRLMHLLAGAPGLQTAKGPKGLRAPAGDHAWALA